MAFLKKHTDKKDNKAEESKVTEEVIDTIPSDDTASQVETVEKKESMAERHTVKNNSEDVVMPTFETETKRKAIVQISEEQSSYDDMNSILIEDKKVEQVAIVEDKKDKKKEVNKKLKPFKIAAACVAGAGVVTAGVLIGLNIANRGTDIELKPVDINSQSSNVSTSTSGTEEKEPTPIEKDKPMIGESTIDKPMNVGEYYIKNLVVNIQEVAGQPYKNIETEYYYGLSEVVSGYDNVVKYVDEYNKEATKKIKIGNKEDIADDLSLVMFTVNLDFPSSFPSNLGDNMFRDVPDIKIRLIGNPVVDKNEIVTTEENDSHGEESSSEAETNDSVTVSTEETSSQVEESSSETNSDTDEIVTTEGNDSQGEESSSDAEENNESTEVDDIEHYTDYITLNGKEYDIHELKAIYIKENSINVKDGGFYRFITTMPLGADDTNYIIEVTVGDEVMFYNGVEIK